MKRYRIIFILLLISHVSYSQIAQLKIIGQPEIVKDVIIAVVDANGRFCAGIQIVSDINGFSYNSYNGVVRVDHQPGQGLTGVYLSNHPCFLFPRSSIGTERVIQDP